jgi:multiple antibiotic resistance protein
VVPRAIPMLAGPGAMAAAMMLEARAVGFGGGALLYVAIAPVLLIADGALRAAPALQRVLGLR